MFPEFVKHLFKVQQVTVEIRGENYHIIQVDKESIIYQAPKAPLHQALEYCRGIAEPQRHPVELI